MYATATKLGSVIHPITIKITAEVLIEYLEKRLPNIFLLIVRNVIPAVNELFNWRLGRNLLSNLSNQK